MGDEERKPSGCGLLLLYNNVFRRTPPPAPSPRRCSSTNSMPATTPPTAAAHLTHSNSKRRRSTSDEPNANAASSSSSDVHVGAAPLNYPKAPAAAPGSSRPAPMQGQGQGQGQGRGRARNGGGGGGGISGELDSMINDYQRTKGNSTLVRASSGNVMLYGHLGNLRAPGALTANRNVMDYLPQTAHEKSASANANNASAAKAKAKDNANPHVPQRQQQGRGGGASKPEEAEVAGSMCRALSRRLDPEELKEMGNEEYKLGNFAEAVALYDRAILMDPQKASYWSNKAAALTGLGKLLDAVAECKEAVRMEPSYHRAHHRLGSLYLRLGEAERALHHFKLSRNEATSSDISRVQSFQSHLSKCSEARRLKDWPSMLKETDLSLSSGADSSPQVFAFKAEALLMLHKHEDAENTLNGSPKFDIDASTKFFGAMKSAFSLMIRAQVDMAAGRFEDALSLANKAARLDTSGEAGAIAKKARLVATARATGNDLFKASNFEQACASYGEGLDYDPHNAILMCNRAACRSKLGQWDNAIQDCNAALRVRPSYSKARLRRADCNAKLGKWEASIQDYEALLQEMPEDDKIGTALRDAQAQLRKNQGCTSDVACVATMDHFREVVMSPGLSVALFFDSASNVSKQMVPLMEQLSRQYPSVNFLKVNIEEIPNFAKSERISKVPTFRIYKKGGDVREVSGADCDKLEGYLKNEQ